MSIQPTSVTPYSYHGLPLYYTLVTDQAKGEVTGIHLSYRRPPSKRSKKAFGSILYSASYSLRALHVRLDDENLPEILHQVLGKKIPQFFLQGLFDEHPELLTDNRNLTWHVVVPYILEKEISQGTWTSPSVQKRVRAVADRLLQEFGDEPISLLTREHLLPWIRRMNRADEQQCVSLLKKISAVIWSPDSPEGKQWDSLTVSQKHSDFSPARQIRAKLQVPLLEEITARQILSRCQEEIQLRHNPLYFGASVMLLEGISSAELCALQYGDFRPLRQYPGHYRLCITKSSVAVGEPNRERRRKRKHSIRPLENPHQWRNLPVGTWLTKQYATMSEGKDADAYLLSNPDVPSRLLHPEDFDAWLQETFGPLIPEMTHQITSEKAIVSHHSAADYFAGTANLALRQYGITDEEYRRLCGLAPSRTDSRFYHDFNSDSELLFLANVQDRWVSDVLPGCSFLDDAGDSDLIRYYSPAKPHKAAGNTVRILVKPGEVMQDPIIIEVLSKFDCQVSARLVPYDQKPAPDDIPEIPLHMEELL